MNIARKTNETRVYVKRVVVFMFSRFAPPREFRHNRIQDYVYSNSYDAYALCLKKYFKHVLKLLVFNLWLDKLGQTTRVNVLFEFPTLTLFKRTYFIRTALTKKIKKQLNSKNK